MTAKHLLSEIVADPEDARKMFNEWRALFGMDGPVKVGMVSQPVERLANGAAYVEQLERALGEFDCPRPCNGRPDDFTVAQCVGAGECGLSRPRRPWRFE